MGNGIPRPGPTPKELLHVVTLRRRGWFRPPALVGVMADSYRLTTTDPLRAPVGEVPASSTMAADVLHTMCPDSLAPDPSVRYVYDDTPNLASKDEQ
ncbi:hypothetical protein GCM10020219_015870 [Nonomuraea dietziae]